jgi:hypothetical protein
MDAQLPVAVIRAFAHTLIVDCWPLWTALFAGAALKQAIEMGALTPPPQHVTAMVDEHVDAEVSAA